MDTMTLFTTSATRSRRATASIVAGMTLAGAAAVGFSAPAQAATVDTWDRLAECESNGTWDINTGNGFYGGVQFTLSSWQAVGGEGYPHQASKAEQIKRAEILQDLQGWGAWPLCSQKLGLTQADAEAGDVDATEAAPVAVERTATVQRQSAADEAAAEQAAADEAAAEQAVVAEAETIVVKSGDSLWTLANEYEVEGGWTALYEANKGAVSDAAVIYVGQELVLPQA